jgi:hypothetical protein
MVNFFVKVERDYTWFFCTGRRPEVLVHFARVPDALA